MNRYAPFLFSLFAVVFVSCNGAGTKSSNAAGNENAAVTAVASAAKDDAEYLEVCDRFPMDTLDGRSPALEISISLPCIAGNDSRSESMNREIRYSALDCDAESTLEAIDRFISDRKSEYYGYRPNYLNEKGMNSSPSWLNFSYNIKGEMVESRGNTLCCRIYRRSYEGDVHGCESTFYLTFDNNNGRLLLLDDIFAEGYYETLCNLLAGAFAKKFGVGNFDEVRGLGYFEDMDIYPSNNFVLSEDSMLFHYNSSEIAPYALGETSVKLGYDELEKIMK